MNTNTFVTASVEGGKSLGRVELVNISVGGALVVFPGPVSAGARVQIEIPVDDPEGSILCTGLIVWTKGEGETGAESGIRFIEMPLSTMRRLAKYVNQQLAGGS